MNGLQRISEFMNENNGYISTRDLKKIGFNSNSIKNLIINKVIRKVSHGLYIDYKLFADELYIYQQIYSDIVYSYNTSFFLQGISERMPSKYDVTVPRGRRIRDEYNLIVHQVVDEKYKLGIIETLSPLGNPIRVYNIERCICDIIKYPEKIEPELKYKIINIVFKKRNFDIDLLIEYSKKFNIYKEIKVLLGAMID